MDHRQSGQRKPATPARDWVCCLVCGMGYSTDLKPIGARCNDLSGKGRMQTMPHGEAVIRRCPGRVVTWLPELEAYLTLVRRVPLDCATLWPVDPDWARKYLQALGVAWAQCSGADDMANLSMEHTEE